MYLDALKQSLLGFEEPLSNAAKLFEWKETKFDFYGGSWQQPTDPVAKKNKDKPLCRFREIGIVFHSIFWQQTGSEWPFDARVFKEEDDILDPIERDIIAYSQRDLNNRPLHSRVLDSTQVEVTFPSAVVYSGEGATYGVKLSSTGSRTVACVLTRCCTQFRNGAIVFHLGIKPLQYPLLDDAMKRQKNNFDELLALPSVQDDLKELDSDKTFKVLKDEYDKLQSDYKTARKDKEILRDDGKSIERYEKEIRGRIREAKEKSQDASELENELADLEAVAENVKSTEQGVEEKAREIVRKIKFTARYIKKTKAKLSRPLTQNDAAAVEVRRSELSASLISAIDAEALNEFEITMLVKMWEGGEGYDPTKHNSVKFRRMRIDKSYMDLRAKNIKNLVKSEFATFLSCEFAYLPKFEVVVPRSSINQNQEMPEEELGNRLYLIGGTIETLHAESLNFLKEYLRHIRLDDKDHATTYLKDDAERIRELLGGMTNRRLLYGLGSPRTLRRATRHRLDPPIEPTPEERKKVGLALAAIGTGLFDVQNLDDDEMMESLRFELSSEKQALLVNKGTLLAVETEERIFDAHGDDMGCSPYLWLPHTVSIYNNLVLRSAEQKFQYTSKLGREEDYQNAEFRLRELIQENYIVEAFHYQMEKDLTNRCSENRGLVTQHKTATERIHAVNGILDELRQAREGIQGWMLEIFVAVLAIVQLISGYEALNDVINSTQDSSLLYAGFLLIVVALLCGSLVWYDRKFYPRKTPLQEKKYAEKKHYFRPIFILLALMLVSLCPPLYLYSHYWLICAGVVGICAVLILYNYLHADRSRTTKRMTGKNYLHGSVFMLCFLIITFFLIHQWVTSLPDDLGQEVVAKLDDLHTHFLQVTNDSKWQSIHDQEHLDRALEKTVEQDKKIIEEALKKLTNDVAAITHKVEVASLSPGVQKKLNEILKSLKRNISAITSDVESIKRKVAAISAPSDADPVHWKPLKMEMEKIYRGMGLAYIELQELTKKVAETKEIVIKLSVIPLDKNETLEFKERSKSSPK